MTFLDAAQKVLEQAGKGNPLAHGEIWKRIKEQGLVETKGKTPVATLSTELRRSMLGSALGSKHAVPRFYRDDDHRFGLLEWLTPEEKAARLEAEKAHVGRKEKRQVAKQWRQELWALIEQESAERDVEPRFRMHWRGKPEPSVEVVVVDGKLNVARSGNMSVARLIAKKWAAAASARSE